VAAVLYLFAVIGAVTVGVILWQLVRGEQARVPSRRADAPNTAPQRRKVIGPDDDPDFLRSLGDDPKDQ
jgi:hypothetical protein